MIRNMAVNTLSEAQKLREAELIAICKFHQGEYLPAYHGRGSWATTYANEFIAASKELCAIYEAAGECFPQYALARSFREAGITSCRGSIMTFERAEYLYTTHIKV